MSATPSGGFGYFELDESSMIYGERVIQASGSIYVDGNEEKVQLMMMGQFDYRSEQTMNNSTMHDINYAFKRGGDLEIIGIDLKVKDAVDIINWHKSKNTIIGSEFDDIIDGGAKKDKLRGKGGADMFVASKGKDQVMDFSLTEGDKIVVSGDFDIVEKGKHVIVTHDRGKMKILDVSAQEINASIIDQV